jgi:tripartite-type tricarboxylate transporter receptor subunit TctC
LFGTLLLHPPAQAQTPAPAWPSSAEPIVLIVGNVAGGGNDIMARLMSERLTVRLKHSVVVENKPGASGTIGAAFVAQSPPNGNTLLIAPSSSMVAALVQPKEQLMPVNLLTDLQPIIRLTTGSALVLSVNPSIGVKDAKGLVEYARQHQVTYGTPGIGTTFHIAGEAFNHAAGIHMIHVPYKGLAPAVQDLLGNHVTAVISDLSTVAPYLKTGKLVAVGSPVASRSPYLPDVPTLTEQGYPGIEMPGWFGVFGPRNMDPALVEKINREFNVILTDPKVIQELTTNGDVPSGGSAAEFAKVMVEHYERQKKVVEFAGIKP